MFLSDLCYFLDAEQDQRRIIVCVAMTFGFSESHTFLPIPKLGF